MPLFSAVFSRGYKGDAPFHIIHHWGIYIVHWHCLREEYSNKNTLETIDSYHAIVMSQRYSLPELSWSARDFPHPRAVFHLKGRDGIDRELALLAPKLPENVIPVPDEFLGPMSQKWEPADPTKPGRKKGDTSNPSNDEAEQKRISNVLAQQGFRERQAKDWDRAAIDVQDRKDELKLRHILCIRKYWNEREIVRLDKEANSQAYSAHLHVPRATNSAAAAPRQIVQPSSNDLHQPVFARTSLMKTQQTPSPVPLHQLGGLNAHANPVPMHDNGAQNATSPQQFGVPYGFHVDVASSSIATLNQQFEQPGLYGISASTGFDNLGFGMQNSSSTQQFGQPRYYSLSTGVVARQDSGMQSASSAQQSQQLDYNTLSIGAITAQNSGVQYVSSPQQFEQPSLSTGAVVMQDFGMQNASSAQQSEQSGYYPLSTGASTAQNFGMQNASSPQQFGQSGYSSLSTGAIAMQDFGMQNASSSHDFQRTSDYGVVAGPSTTQDFGTQNDSPPHHCQQSTDDDVAADNTTMQDSGMQNDPSSHNFQQPSDYNVGDAFDPTQGTGMANMAPPPQPTAMDHETIEPTMTQPNAFVETDAEPAQNNVDAATGDNDQIFVADDDFANIGMDMDWDFSSFDIGFESNLVSAAA